MKWKSKKKRRQTFSNIFQKKRKPERKKNVLNTSWEVCNNIERYLRVGQEIVKFNVPRKEAVKSSKVLPLSLLPTIRWLGKNPSPLEVTTSFSLEEETEITAILEERLLELQKEKEWKEGYDKEGWNMLLEVAQVIAEGMSYPYLPLSESTIIRRWKSRSKGKAHPIWKKLHFFEYLVASVFSAFRIRFGSARYTRRVITKTTKGVCRHYAFVAQTLFDFLKKSHPAFSNCHVISVAGIAKFSALNLHSWNWFVDEKMNVILPFDLSSADWLMDRMDAASILNERFSATHFNNLSVFLLGLMISDESHLPLSLALDLFPKMIELDSQKGVLDLFRLACQPLAPKVRERIQGYLESRGRLLPLGWKQELEMANARWGWAGTDPVRQHILLDLVMVKT